MARKVKQAEVAPTKFSREYSMIINGFEINSGDMIKIKDEYGTVFKFDCITTNIETGSFWVDCFEMFRGKASQYRSFSMDRVKRIAKRGKRAKRVN
jgi:hypothetical protein